MEKKSPKKKEEKKVFKLSDEPDLTEAGDKHYIVDTEQVLFKLLKDFSQGTLEIDDVIIKREYVAGAGEQVRILHTEVVHKTEAPKATVAIFHGLGQNSDPFIDYAINFAMNGYKVQLIDFRGFGWSGGIRLESTIVDLQNDVATLLKEADAELPMFLYAHSMG